MTDSAPQSADQQPLNLPAAGRFALSPLPSVQPSVDPGTVGPGTADLGTAVGSARPNATEHTQQLEFMVEATGLGFFTIDLISGAQTWDAQMRRLYGLPDDRPAPQSNAELKALVHPQDWPAVAASLNRIADGSADAAEDEFRICRPDGTERRVVTRSRAMWQGDRRVNCGVVIDVSALREAEKRANDEHERASAASKSAGLGIWERDLRTSVSCWDEQMYRLRGLSLDEPRSPNELRVSLTHPDDLDTIDTAFDIALRRGGVYECEFRVIWPDGSFRWLQSRGVMMRDDTGSVVRVLGINWDITERRTAEQALRLLQERTTMAAQAAGIGTWEMDVATRDTFWDEQMYLLRGLAPNDPRPIDELIRTLPPEDEADQIRHKLSESMKTGQPYRSEFRVRWPDGSVRWLASRGMVIRGARGDMPRMFGVNWDITEQKRNEQITRDKHAAEQSNRAKSEFLARMSHELRTPLNAVIGFSQLLAEDPLEPPSKRQRERLVHVLGAGQHLLSLIDDVLDLSSIEAAAEPLLREPVALAPLVEEALGWVADHARDRNVSLRPQALHGVVMADRRRVQQILLNLLSNAVKYNRPGGHIDISITHRTGARGAQWGLVVGDSGRGMTEAQIAHVFEPFNRLGAERSDIEGTGIGLTIVLQLARRMDGEIEVTSEPGVGSQFCLWLARAPEPIDPRVQSLMAPDATEIQPPARSEGALRILCVEDNPVNLVLVEQVFSLRPQMHLTTAEDGTAGIEHGLSEPFDVILLDMQLPDMTGMDVMRRLRAEALQANARFIAFSANAMPEDVAAARSAGFFDYWTKPIDFPKFLKAIDVLAAQAADTR